MDLDALRAKLTPETKVVFFCSPHNPGGTAWSADEIRALAAFCAERDLILVSDEIHCDLVFAGARHTPTLRRRARDRRPADHLRCRHQDLQSRRRPCRRLRHLQPGTEAPARRADRGQRARLLQRLRHDRDRGGVADRRGVARCAAGLPRRPTAICSTRASRRRRPARARCGSMPPISPGSISPAPVSRPTTSRTGSTTRARIFASPGPQFGPGGDSWLRFNFATPRPILEEALDRLDDAFKDLRTGGEGRPMKQTRGRRDRQRHTVENRFAAQRRRREEPPRGGRGRGRAADHVRRHAGDYRCRRPAGRRSTACC